MDYAGNGRGHIRLAELGHAHSVEAWQGDALAGGLYGVAVGRMFFGESMFTRVRDASKVALVRLARQLEAWNMPMIDCQMSTQHLASLGARDIRRTDFVDEVRYLYGSRRWLPRGRWTAKIMVSREC